MCTLLRKYLSIINSLVITSNSCTRQQTGGSTNKHLTGQSTRISQAVKDLRKCAISFVFVGFKVLARNIYWDSTSFPSDLYGYSSKLCEYWIEKEIVWHDDTFGHVWSPRLKVGWWTRRKVKNIMRWWSKNHISICSNWLATNYGLHVPRMIHLVGTNFARCQRVWEHIQDKLGSHWRWGTNGHCLWVKQLGSVCSHEVGATKSTGTRLSELTI